MTIVFEDHANAGRNAVVDATKARQAVSHPDWMKENVPGISLNSIYPVLVTPATKAKQGAMPHLSRVWFWELDAFVEWAGVALDTIRELRNTFVEPGDLAWRADAARKLTAVRADGPGLVKWLSSRSARDHLEAVP